MIVGPDLVFNLRKVFREKYSILSLVAPEPVPLESRLQALGVRLGQQRGTGRLLVCNDDCEQPTVSLGERTWSSAASMV